MLLPKKHSRILRLFQHFFYAYPKRSAAICVLLLLAAAAEGLGMATLLPLLNIVIAHGSAETESSELSQAIEGVLLNLGITPGAGSILLVIVFLITAKSCLVLLAMTQVGVSANRVAADMRLNLIRNLMSARWAYFVRQRVGDLTAALGSEPNRAAKSYTALCQMLVAIAQAIVYMALAATVSFHVTIAAIVIGTLSAMLLNRFVRIGAKAGQQQTKVQRQFLSLLSDCLHVMKPIKATAGEGQISPLLDRYIEALNKAQNGLVVTNQALKNLQEPIRVAAAALGFFLLISIWTDSADTLILLTLLFLRTVDRIGMIQRGLQQALVNQPAFWFVRNTIKQAEAAKEENRGGSKPTLNEGLSLKDLSFSYGKTQILDGLSLEIPARKMVSLVGRSGTGKSTIADLLTGLLEPTKGEIIIDGLALKEADLSAWRRMIGYVPQDSVLLHDSISANVTLGDPSLTPADAKEALTRAEAWDFIEAMPEGLDTVVGEKGMRLSGGQRQRIAIARALVRRPQFLILDEATSALDPETEASICKTMKVLSTDLTILAISHNKLITEFADYVYQLEGRSLLTIKDPKMPPPETAVAE